MRGLRVAAVPAANRAHRACAGAPPCWGAAQQGRRPASCSHLQPGIVNAQVAKACGPRLRARHVDAPHVALHAAARRRCCAAVQPPLWLPPPAPARLAAGPGAGRALGRHTSALGRVRVLGASRLLAGSVWLGDSKAGCEAAFNGRRPGKRGEPGRRLVSGDAVITHDASRHGRPSVIAAVRTQLRWSSTVPWHLSPQL